MIADIAVPRKLYQSFDYLLPSELEDIGLGSVVEVPFGKEKTVAFVVGLKSKSEIEVQKLKKVERSLVSFPYEDPKMFEFLKWVAGYYCTPIGEVLSAAIPRVAWETKVVKSVTKESRERSVAPALNSSQQNAVEEILKTKEGAMLLQGVTGSGKTEVYMKVLEHTLSTGKNALVLVPEIALTPQLFERFESRFSQSIGILHSGLTPSQRIHNWRAICEGKARIVIGARSAVFAPVHSLGIIIVDEEHEPSFKQEDSFRYHARDVAVARANFFKIPIVLGSATPSFETYLNAKNGKYRRVRLPSRISTKTTQWKRVDLRVEEERIEGVPWLSRTLASAIASNLKKKEQTLLFLNRLGFARFLICESCGETFECKQCDVTYTLYQRPNRLICHYCGRSRGVPLQCPQCDSIELKPIGIGTEQVQDQIQKLYPEAKVARMDRSVISTRKSLVELLEAIAQRKVDIVVGTQMLAKGHDYPNITLVGILMADASLQVPDFRAHERTFQLISQVAGRAGRADKEGLVILQSYNPSHPLFDLVSENQIDDFISKELEGRKIHQFPPFHRMALFRFQSKNPMRVEKAANEAHRFLSSLNLADVLIGPPSESLLRKINGFLRWNILVRSNQSSKVQALAKALLEWAQVKLTSVQVSVDIDPLHLS